MSAYIVDREHIQYLVAAAMSNRLNPYHGPFHWYWGFDAEAGSHQYDSLACNDYDKAAEVANMLWQENIKSVSHRYPNEGTDTLPGPTGENYTIQADDICLSMWDSIDPMQVLKSIACYGYQTCEHPAWKDSQAFAFCEALKSAAINALPGYDEAEWGAPETLEEKREAYRKTMTELELQAN